MSAKTLSSSMNVLVFSTQRLASYLSSRVLSSIFLPYTPPWALTWSKYALVPRFIWMPNWAAGPEKAADWPSRIDLVVTPGVWAMVLSGTTLASRQAIKNLVFMANPPFVTECGLRSAALQGAAGLSNRPIPVGRSRLLYCGRPVAPNFSRLPSAIGVSIAAALVTLCAAALCAGIGARATTTGFIAVLAFACGSAAKTEEEIRKQPATRIAAHMIKSPLGSAHHVSFGPGSFAHCPGQATQEHKPCQVKKIM